MNALLVLAGCVVMGILWSRFNQRVLRDFFSPLNLLFYFWMLPFSASYLYLSALQSGLSMEATLLIIACTLFLIATSLLPVALIGGQPLFVRCDGAFVILRRRFSLVVVFYLLALTAEYFAEFHNLEIPLLAYLSLEAASSTLHTVGSESKLQILAFGAHVAIMFIFFIALNTRGFVKRLLLILLVASVFLAGFLKASKTDVFIPMIVCSALLYYHHKHRGTRVPTRWKVLGLVASILLVSLTSVRLIGVGIQGGYATAIEFRYVDELGPVLSEFVSIVYGYTSLGFENLSNVMAQSDEKLRLGTSLFRPLLSMVLQGDLAQSIEFPQERWNVITKAANVGTYLTPLYLEGGVVACLLGSLLYGLLVNCIYIAFRRWGGVWLFVYVSLIFPWTWFFFMNAFSVLSVYVNLFYVLLFFFVWRHKRMMGEGVYVREATPSR